MPKCFQIEKIDYHVKIDIHLLLINDASVTQKLCKMEELHEIRPYQKCDSFSIRLATSNFNMIKMTNVVFFSAFPGNIYIYTLKRMEVLFGSKFWSFGIWFIILMALGPVNLQANVVERWHSYSHDGGQGALKLITKRI